MSSTGIIDPKPPAPETCAGCRFYRADNSICRRFPPQVGMSTFAGSYALSPIVDPNNWCGEWQTKEPYRETLQKLLALQQRTLEDLEPQP